MPDKKVSSGNNRQFDILAYSIQENSQYHIEVGVTHRENWCPAIDDLEQSFEKKFFGKPPEREGANKGNTDNEKGKSYFPSIIKTYEEIGFDPSKIHRVWVCWMLKGEEDNTKPIFKKFRPYQPNEEFCIEILSLRDYVLPQLLEKIGTSNYDDEVLRTLGFMKQKEQQTKK